jgi:hypothetical protein
MGIISLAFLEEDLVNYDFFWRQSIKFIEHRRGAKVRRQTDIMPAGDSSMTHVQAFASVPVEPW